jgi:hypothetical protein
MRLTRGISGAEIRRGSRSERELQSAGGDRPGYRRRRLASCYPGAWRCLPRSGRPGVTRGEAAFLTLSRQTARQKRRGLRLKGECCSW